jgi:hypothetical protein
LPSLKDFLKGNFVKKSKRHPAKLSDAVHHRLNLYTLAATAAGTGLFAAIPAAEAKVVYTHAHVTIERGHTMFFPLDLNHDRKVDFYVAIVPGSSGLSAGSSGLVACHLRPRQVYGCGSSSTASNAANAIRVEKSNHFSWGVPIVAGRTIDNNARFESGRPVGLGVIVSYPGPFGPWMNGGKGVKTRFLGIKFKIKDKFHFGWARMSVRFDTNKDIITTLTGYAYETVPNKAIVAGDTGGAETVTLPGGSLGHLARGAAAH